MKKKKVISGFIIAIVIVVGIIFAWKGTNDYSRILKTNWDFSIPSNAQYSEIYSKDAGASFHGDGVRYHMFYCKNLESVDTLFAWQKEEKSTIFSESYSRAVDGWLDMIKVPEEKRPNYSECLYWYDKQNDDSEIIVLWDRDKKMLYAAESFL